MFIDSFLYLYNSLDFSHLLILYNHLDNTNNLFLYMVDYIDNDHYLILYHHPIIIWKDCLIKDKKTTLFYLFTSHSPLPEQTSPLSPYWHFRQFLPNVPSGQQSFAVSIHNHSKKFSSDSAELVWYHSSIAASCFSRKILHYKYKGKNNIRKKKDLNLRKVRFLHMLFPLFQLNEFH